MKCFVAKVVTTLRAIHCGYRPLSQFNRSISSTPKHYYSVMYLTIICSNANHSATKTLHNLRFSYSSGNTGSEGDAGRRGCAPRYAQGKTCGMASLEKSWSRFRYTPLSPCNLQWNRRVGVRFSGVGFLIEKYGKDIIPSINQVVLFPEVKRWNIEEMAHTCTMKATWYSSYIIKYHAINRWVVSLGLCKCCTTS